MQKFYQQSLNFLNKYRAVLFIVILVLGIWYRFFYVTETQEWFGDFGRDAIVAKHLVMYPETYNLSPLAASSAGTLNNTPVYYWILGVIWFFTRSENGLIYFFAGMGATSIYLSYILSKKFFHGLYVLIFPLFISFSNLMIVTSRNVWQPYFIPPLLLMTLICLVNGYKGQRNQLLYAIQLSFITTFIHLSFLPLLFVNIITLLVYAVKFRLKKFLGTLLIVIAANTLLWASFSPIVPGNDVSKIASNLLMTRGGVEKFIANIGVNSNILHENILPMFSGHLFGIFVILSMANLLVYAGKNNQTKVINQALFTLTFSVFFLAGYHNKLSIHYLLSYHVLILLIFSLFIEYLGRHSKVFALICVVIIYTGVSNGNHTIRNSDKVMSEIKIARSFATEISASINTVPLLNMCLKSNEPCFKDTISPGVWYFLEEVSKKRYGYISPGSQNYLKYESVEMPKQIYLICNYELENCQDNSQVSESEATLLKSFSGSRMTLYKID